MAKKEPLIEFRNISKRFNRTRVLDNVSLTINHNDLFGLIGPSGAGKTTLINILLGLVKKSTGRILVKGKAVRSKKNFLQSIGFCTQENAFYPRLTVFENLMFYGKMYGMSARDIKIRCNELLELIELKRAKNRQAKKLSGGMKRRLDFAIALIHNPEVLVLDEPFSGLDIMIQQKIWKVIKKIHESGTTVIVSSHLLRSLETHCTSYGLLYEGKLYDTQYLNKYKKRYKINNIEDLFIKIFEGNSK